MIDTTHDLGARIDAVLDGMPGDEPDGPQAPFIIAADALMRKAFPEPRWAVPGLFPEGLTLLVGAPKLGKSWLALGVALAVASGGYALGRVEVAAGDVLYCALEDTERRLQERLAMLLDADAPDRLHFATAWPTIAGGAVEHLSAWLANHPETRLLVIDTFQRLRGPVPGNQNAYAADYTAAAEIKAVADRHGVAVVLVHHTRKAGADDPLDMVSGTNGLAGAADAIGVLRREIGRHDATIYLRGRDVPEADHALSFDPQSCSWTLLGDAGEFRLSEERREIVDVLRNAPEPLAPKAIAEVLGKKPTAVRYLLHKMVKAGEIDGIGGAYRLPLSSPNTPNTANSLGDLPVLTGNHNGLGVRVPHAAANGQPEDAGVTVRGHLPTANGRNHRNDRHSNPSVSAVRGVNGGEVADTDLPETCQIRDTCARVGPCRDWLGKDCMAALGRAP